MLMWKNTFRKDNVRYSIHADPKQETCFHTHYTTMFINNEKHVVTFLSTRRTLSASDGKNII